MEHQPHITARPADVIDLSVKFNPVGAITRFNTAWLECWVEINSEMTGFVATRIRENLDLQKRYLGCQSLGELQALRVDYMETAVDQYSAERSKLIDITGKAVAKVQGEYPPYKHATPL